MSLALPDRVIPINHRAIGVRSPDSSPVVRWFERNRVPVLVFVSALSWVIAATIASVRLLWFDELVTLYIAKTGSLRNIWHALSLGADPNPPLSHLLVLWSTRVFGDGALAVRLPMVIAGAATVPLLFLFMNRRLPVVFSTIGALFFISTRAYDYSYESRSYALTLCFCVLTLVLWRAALEGSHRLASSFGLALTLAAGISSNYFAVLAFFPIAAGELVRIIQNRRLELRVWIALLFGGLPIFLYLPLINHAVSQFAPYAWNRATWSIVNHTYDLLLDASLVFVFILLEAAAVIYLYRRFGESRKSSPVFPSHEIAAILTLLAYPVLGYVLAVLRAGMISPRFVLPMCLGIAMAIAIASYELFAKSSVLTIALLAVVFSWALARNMSSASGLIEQRDAFLDFQAGLPATGKLVVPDSLLALPLYYYSPAATASRIVFPFDLKAIRQFKGEDSAEQNLWAGRSIWPLAVEPIDQIECDLPSCHIIAPAGNWLIWKLVADATPAKPLGVWIHSGRMRERGFLFSLTFGGVVYVFGPPGKPNCAAEFGADRSSERFLTRSSPPAAANETFGNERSLGLSQGGRR